MIILILLVGLILRLVNLNQSLWLDEAINAVFVRSLDLKSLIFNYSLSDFHPPLYHILMKGWVILFGSSEIALRMPSVILGVASIYVIYKIGKKLFDEKTALVAATLLATAPLHIYYSQEARMYMLASFFATVSVYFFISLIKEDKLKNWAGFIISTALLLYSDYLPYLMILVYLFYLFLYKKSIKKPTMRSFVPAFLLIALIILPWFLIFPKQLATGLSAANLSPAWAQVVGAPSINTFLITFVKFTIGRISNGNNALYALMFTPIGIFVSILFALSTFRISKIRSLLYFWFFVPIFLAFTAAFFVPIFSYFRLLFVLGAFYLIWASAINTVNWTLPTRILLIIALTINLGSTVIYLMNPKFERENWKKASAYVLDNADKKSIVLFESTYTLAPFDYYNNGKVDAKGALDSFSPSQDKIRQNVELFTKGKNKVFLFQYLSPITDPQGLLFKELTRVGFANTKTQDINSVGFIYEFKK